MKFLRLVRPGPKVERSRMARAAEQWLDYLQNDRRLAKSSVETYRSTLTQAFRLAPPDFSMRELHKAMEHRLGERASAHVRRATYVTLNQFFEWWEDHGGPDNPLADMRAPAKPQSRRRGLTADELEILRFRLKAVDIKDRAEVYLMLHNGFRVSDVIHLRVEDIDFQGAQVRAHHGKGGTDEWLPMGPTVASVLKGYLDQTGINAGWVFTGPRGQMRIQAVWGAWQRVLKGCPELKGLKPHQLRHSFANNLLRDDEPVDIHTVMHLMRHRTLSATQGYLDRDETAERGAILRLDNRLNGL